MKLRHREISDVPKITQQTTELSFKSKCQETLFSKFLSSCPWVKELSYYEMNWNHQEQ